MPFAAHVRLVKTFHTNHALASFHLGYPKVIGIYLPDVVSLHITICRYKTAKCPSINLINPVFLGKLKE